jgi:dipeptidyl-peptidase-4
MTDTFPRQYARTQRLTLGAPRSFEISPDGNRVVFLRSKGGSDPVTCLWMLDVTTGREHLVADPAELGSDGGDLDPAEKARRERTREQAAGIVAFCCDADFRLAVFGLSGRVYAADLSVPGTDGTDAGTDGTDAGTDGTDGADAGTDGTDAGTDGTDGADAGTNRAAAVREVPTLTPAADPRPDPAGRLVAYTCAGALRVVSLDSGEDRVIAAPDPAADISWGMAEFIAAEEMGRARGYWWAPDSRTLLAARVDEAPVQRWHIADPSNPGQPAAQVRYPAAGTPNADVSLVLAGLDGGLTPVSWDTAEFPYLVTAYWAGPAGDSAAGDSPAGDSPAGDSPAANPPLIVVQARDQREMRLLEVDRQSGATTLLRADTDPRWLDIIPGVPARTAGGQIVWTTDADGAHRLVVASAADLAAGRAAPVTPDRLQVREVLSADGDTILFAASAEEPTEVGLWTYRPGSLARLAVGDGGPGVHSGARAGGTTVAVRRSPGEDGATFHVLRSDIQVARVTSLAEEPLLPPPAPTIFAAGQRGLRTALLLPSWHQPGTAKLPVLLDPYGGPHLQRVLASRGAFLASQWFAEQGFAVVVADGRGTPGRGPDWEKAVAGDLAGPPLADQVDALHGAAARCADLDLGRVAIRGWSFGGYLSALAVLRRPDVFHAAVAGAPVTEWRLYDTHYTERYLGHPDDNKDVYDACSLLADAHKLRRPLLIIHGLADDNVVVAHSLRLSTALLAAGRPHSVLPLSGVTHMASQEEVAENLLLLQVDFLRTSLGVAIVTPGLARPAPSR